MTLKHFLFSALMLLSAGTAWADVEINETNFPDASFRNYLLSQDYGSDGKLTDEEIAGVTSINVSGTYFSPGTISSLKGIEFFTALEDLRCNDNQLNSLDVSGCTALTTLFCYNNQLTSLDVSKNTALTWLQCDNNQLTSLDVSKNTALTRLECYDNPLTSLDVSKNTALETLSCGSNQLTSLDLSKNTALIYLDCFDNQLTSLDVSKNTALTGLECYSNQLTSLDVSKNTKLTSLKCQKNPLTSLDVSKNTALTELECYSNQLTSLDVSKNTALEILWCYNNQLTSLDLSKNTALKYLSCGGNQLTSLDLSKNTALTRLHCYSNQLTSLDVSGCTALTELWCYSNQLTSLDISGCTALTELRCYDNQLTSLDVSKNTVLTRLYCYQNRIKGAAMDALVASLPTVSNGSMRVVYNEDEQNEMTKVQVAVAKDKGWTPMKYDGTGWEELKIITPMPDLTPEELLKIDMISSDMSSWFVDKETKIQGSNVQVTKNINLAETKYKTGSIQTADGKTHPYSYFYVPAASTANPNVGFYLPYNLKGKYDIYLVTMPTWTYQNNFDEEKHRYRFRASIWEKDEQNNFPSTGTALTVDGNNTFETPEVDANVITDTTFIGTYDFQHAYTDYNTPGVILQINSHVMAIQRRTYSYSMIFAGVVLVSKEYVTKVETVETSETEDSAPWYTINGVKLAEKPTAPGIYIHGGKKVVVK
jgi:Leucine-rich repeat (LRR) protein